MSKTRICLPVHLIPLEKQKPQSVFYKTIAEHHIEKKKQKD